MYFYCAPAGTRCYTILYNCNIFDMANIILSQNDDYYTMIRGNKFITETTKHIVMNGGINFVAAQKVEAPPVWFFHILEIFYLFLVFYLTWWILLQLSAVLTQGVKTITALPYVTCAPEKADVEYKDGQIVSATLEALVDMLRPGSSKTYTFTFLLCSRLFIKPHELLSKLCKRYFKNYDKIVSTFNMSVYYITYYVRSDSNIIFT